MNFNFQNNMRGLILIPIFILISVCAFAQNDRTINTNTVKVTFLGLSYSYEQAIAQKSTINYEFMLAGGFGSGYMNGSYWLIVPVMRVEPRYYYNLITRYEKGRKTVNNSANYLSFSADYQLGRGVGSNASSISTLRLIPKWGMKRSVGRHFVFELAAGIGVQKSENYNWEATPGLDLKLGYSF
jgi:hypothetical protein